MCVRVCLALSLISRFHLFPFWAVLFGCSFLFAVAQRLRIWHFCFDPRFFFLYHSLTISQPIVILQHLLSLASPDHAQYADFVFGELSPTATFGVAESRPFH